jgi:hypothetical protein
MATQYVIFFGEAGTDPGRDGILTDAKVNRAAHLLFWIEFTNSFLYHPDPEHLIVQLLENSLIHCPVPNGV